MSEEQSDSTSGSYRINRRGLLALFGFGAVSPVRNIGSNQSENTPSPTEKVSVLPRFTRYPQPVSAEKINHLQYVPAQETVHHTAAWKTVADESREKLETFFEVTEISFTIDGEKVAPSDGSWSWEKISADITESNQAQWRREWTYSTPPKQLGTHDFEATVSYSRPFTSKVSGGESKTREGVQTYEGCYTVIQPSSLLSSQPHWPESDSNHG